MPVPQSVLKFLKGLTFQEKNELAEWLDETPHPETVIVQAIADSRVIAPSTQTKSA